MAGHKAAERELGVAIAPCGLAHTMAATEAMSVTEFSIALLVKDREHMSIEGLYLNACTIALTLNGRPTGERDGQSLDEVLPWAPGQLEPAKASFLRSIARDALAAWPAHLEEASDG